MTDTKKIVEPLYGIATANSRADGIALMEEYLISIGAFGLKRCGFCGTTFVRSVTWQKFCSEACKLRLHEMQHGQAFDPLMYKNFRANDNDLEAILTKEGVLVRKKSNRK